MQALVIEGEGFQGKWTLKTLPDPTPSAGELLIRVKAAGLNRADLRFEHQHYGGTNRIAGGEVAGIVETVGADCGDFVPGDRVMALAPGSFAEKTIVDHRLAIRAPKNIGWIQAAAIPAAYITAHDALVRLGKLQCGQSLLVQGATSGVGIAALQIAQHIGADPVVAVARSAEKMEALAQFADFSFDAQSAWPEEILAETGGRGVDLVLDLVGGATTPGHLSCTAIQGTIVAAGRLGGAATSIDLDLLALRRLTLIGTTFRSRTLAERADVARRFERDMLPAITSGAIEPIIDAVFPLSSADDARKHLSEAHRPGKVVLDLS